MSILTRLFETALGTQSHCHSLSSLHNLKFRLNTGRQCTGNEGSILTAHSLMFPGGSEWETPRPRALVSFSPLYIFVN